MKSRLLFPIVLFVLSFPTFAAEVEKPATTAPDFSSFKTPDEFWKQMEKLQEEPKEKPTTRAEAIAQVVKWFGTQKAAAEAFAKAFPTDARRWQARLIALRADMQMRRFEGRPSDPAADRQKIEEIISAPDAPASSKGEAAFMGVMITGNELDKSKPETYAAFYKAAEAFLEKYPDHPLVGQMKSTQMEVLNDDPSPEAEAMLKKMAAGSDARLAAAAKGILERRQKMAEIKTRPLDLKFTAVDGHPIDLANLRGRVVLVDFWASWCGPCMSEMPNVAATYGKLHDKGFDVVGISLDQDKEAMQGALKEQNMTWPQYFDGAGWQNKISSAFGIQAIPAAWLIDKKGMVREMGLRGEALGAAVEKLLAE